MIGKEKCKYLREIRKKIALENDIRLVTDECAYKGECKGTCPKCEAEVRYLEQELDKRKKLGKIITIAGLSLAGIASSSLLSACCDEGDVGPDPFGSDNVKEAAVRHTLYNNILEYLTQNNIDCSDYHSKIDTLPRKNAIVGFTVTNKGTIRDIYFTWEENPLNEDITALIQSIPQEELSYLQEDWNFKVSYKVINKKVIFEDSRYYTYY